ncbi:MAG: DNA repair protein RecO [Sphaerochaeta sp.]|jgi:DNA repair protein RecO
MNRNVNVQAIVLKARKDGDSNRNLTLLSVDEGIIEIRAFRSRTSKSAPKAYQFQEGMFFLYYNPVNKQYSLKDVQLISPHDGIKQDYEAIISASIMVEFTIRTANDDMANTYQLLARALDFLDDSSFEKDVVVIQFLLRLIKEHGLIEDFKKCPVCGSIYKEKDILNFSQELNVACCSNCEKIPTLILRPKARLYLSYTLGMSFEDALAVKLNESTRIRIKNYMITWATCIMNRPFNSLGSAIN